MRREYENLLAEIDALKQQLDALRPLENPSLLHALAIESLWDTFPEALLRESIDTK